MGEDDESIVREFLVESLENLDQLDRDLVELETHSTNSEIINRIFRIVHTLKGTCGFLSFGKLESVSHVGENLLDNVRCGRVSVTPDIISALLSLSDVLRSLLLTVEQTGSDGEENYNTLITLLTSLNKAPGSAAAMGVSQTPGVTATDSPIVNLQHPIEEESPAEILGEEAPVDELEAVFRAERAKYQAEQQSVAKVSEQKEKSVAAVTPPATEDAKKSELTETALRVDVHLLDKLMNLVGELVLARNQILQFTKNQSDAELISTSQRLNLITSELQEGVMRTRMQPIANVWNKLPRIVRDVAHSCGKQVALEMQGKETELDKTIIEAIKDPLTHIIRNSVDHGIETPEKRLASGKAEEGRLFLRAFHEGGQVNIEIIDDGGGVHLDRVKAKGIERGLITAEQAARMTEREILNLIFLPGFSTAAKITNVSGRGVGMDVVKTNIEKIGGTVDLQSKLGEGTTLRIRIPLTLAIIPALVITSGGDRFAIPQVSLLELVRLEPEQARKGIESIRGTPVYRLRGNLLPLVHLNKLLRTEIPAGINDGTVNIVVLQADERQFGLVVDEINDTEEIVVKPLGKLFKGLTTFAGATIMGDGRVALILDVMGLAQRSNVVSDNKDRAVHETESKNKDTGSSKQAMLLFRVSDTRRMAVPLSQVARLEEFPHSAIEYSGGQQVVQYRSQIMPLISLSEVLADPRLRLVDSAQPEKQAGDTIQVIVYTSNESSIGLVVDRIMGVVEERLVVQRNIVRPGVLGSAVIEKTVTELLDVESVIRTALSGYTESTPALAA